jgi:hypothetical protein
MRTQSMFATALIIAFACLWMHTTAPVLAGSLIVIPNADNQNKVTASIDDSFVLSCIASGSNEEKPKALQWRSPTNQPIPLDTNRRVYTILNGDTLRLYFDKLVPSDSGTYTCSGIEAGVPREVRVDLVLQSKIIIYSFLISAAIV